MSNALHPMGQIETPSRPLDRCVHGGAEGFLHERGRHHTTTGDPRASWMATPAIGGADDHPAQPTETATEHHVHVRSHLASHFL